MGRIAPLIIALALLIYALVDCMQDPDVERTQVGRGLWIMIIVIMPILGPVGWLIVSRMTRPKTPRRRPIAPDDDPDFLRNL